MFDFRDILITDKFRIDEFYRFYSSERINEFNEAFINNTSDLYNSILFKAYNDIVKKCTLLYKELGVVDPNCICVMFEYLLWKGYFSKDKTLFYSFDRVCNRGLEGASIMTGKAVCLNTASMLTDILISLDIEAYIMGCILPKHKPHTYEIDIKVLEDNFKRIVGNTSKKHHHQRANHALTLYKTDNGYMYSDTVNLFFLNNSGVLRASVVGDSNFVIIEPYLFLHENVVSYESFCELFEDIFDQRNRTKMDNQSIALISEETLEICRNNTSLFDDFHDDIKVYIDIVCRKLKK